MSAFGGNQIEFSCRGEADGYSVELSSKTVHFGEVQAQQTTNRLLNVVNDSDLPTSFQFFTDKSIDTLAGFKRQFEVQDNLV